MAVGTYKWFKELEKAILVTPVSENTLLLALLYNVHGLEVNFRQTGSRTRMKRKEINHSISCHVSASNYYILHTHLHTYFGRKKIQTISATQHLKMDT